MSATLLGWQEIERITAQYRKVVRQKLGLPSNTPSSILHHTRLYGLRDLKDAIAEQHISTLHLRSIDKGLVGDLTHCRLQDLQDTANMAESPLTNPVVARKYNKHHLIAKVCQLMVERDISLRDVGAENDDRVLLSRALPQDVFVKHGAQLKKSGVLYLQDIVSENLTRTRTWQEVAATHNIQSTVPKQWYTEVCQAISEHPALDVEEVLFEYVEAAVSPLKRMELPVTPIRTGNNKTDKYNKRLHRKARNRATDEYIIYRKDHEARVKQQKLAKKLKEAAQRKDRTENNRKAKEAAEEALTLKQRFRRQVKARRKELAEEAYQLVPNIIALIQQQATHSKPKHKYKHVIMDPALQESIEGSRKETRPGVRHIYSNGSMVHKGKKECAMAFAVVGEEQEVVQGTTKGFASSVKAELMGLIAGIIATPEDQDLCIRLDNQAVVKQFRDVVANRKRASVRMKLRCDYATEWAVVARICNERTGTTTVEWVKGHDGDKWNEKADLAAKEAQSQNGQAWQIDRSAQDDIKYSVTMAGETLDQDTRHVLKMQTTRRWHQ
ncbi:hypothetical protein BG015_011218, partial [Linnemannia schmuckeri]